MSVDKDTGSTMIPEAAPELAQTDGTTERKPEQADKAKEEKQAEIPVRQLPMDGICGGY